MSAEFRRRADFAEIAEALGVTTHAIFAAKREDRAWFVVYCPHDPNDENDLHTVWLRRGADEILTPVGEPTPRPEMWHEIEKRMKEADA